MKHPFAELIDLHCEQATAGASTMTLVVAPQHLNPHEVVHGAVLYALADTGMGTALYPTLEAGEICATIEIKMNYFKPVFEGKVVCKTTLLNRGRTVANLESRLYVGDVLVGHANGNYAIFRRNRAEG
ncbi:PaaI family thioesterase [Variovorax sp. RO1]|uniref:PaaI family thioesterase n=1 Tax=Variovorax sp. RO1 TaxID=2066034 RepID=UPI000C718522|nr:PaaI family thioesterase [Variovorax sp. RO1]PLC05286.1 PaaI family thioesterase [Variovorax sp. RO1]